MAKVGRQGGCALLPGLPRRASQSQSQRSLLGKTPGIYGVLPTLVGGHHSDEALRYVYIYMYIFIQMCTCTYIYIYIYIYI